MPPMRLKTFLILLLLALAAHGQEKRLAILPTEDDGEPQVEPTDLTYLTARLREIAGNVLQGKYGMMTEQSIIDKLGKDNARKACKEAEGCLAQLGRKISADYIGQARLGRFGGNFTISFVLYNVGSGMEVSTISGNAKEILSLLTVLDEKAPSAFMKMPGVGAKSNSPAISGGISGLENIGGGYELKEKLYLVRLSTEPPGAVLSLNGEPDARKTPYNTEVSEGNVRIIAVLEQHEKADTTVFIRQNNQSINIKLKPNFGVLEIKPAFSDNIGSDKGWALMINNGWQSSYENKLSPGNYDVKLSHECYEDINFKVGINKGSREVFDMAANIKLKKGGLVLKAERNGEPSSEPVYVNGKQAGETPFSGTVPICAEIKIGKNREKVDVELKPNEKVTHTVKSGTAPAQSQTAPISTPKPRAVYWDFTVETIDGPKDPAKLDGKAKALSGGIFYDNDFKGFGYVYGGKTAWREQESRTTGNPKVLAAYMDDNDWSGVTLSLGEGKYMDLSKVRDKGGVYFWVKGSQGGEKVGFGLLDNQGNYIKSQTKVELQDWVEGQIISRNWKLVKIPLKKFSDAGKAWDANKQAEVTKNIQWNKIQEVRFSIGKADNRRNGNQDDPVTLYIDQITFTENIDWIDPDLKWSSFKSSAPDLVLHDFENRPVWEPSVGPRSKLSFKIDRGKLDGNSLNINYTLNDWVDVVYDFERQKAKKDMSDWTKHWGIMFDVYTDKAWQSITVQISDRDREIFVSNTGAPKGRTTVLVPLRSFTKFPYYQPPEAITNGVLDLDGVKILDFKPAGEGSYGYFEIDNVKLTNLREAPKPKVPEIAALTITGNFNNVINPAISPAVFGINAALWDGDLLKPQTKTYVSRINHGIVRYPGGFRADDDHWEQILANKDWMVDTDEFLQWCKETGTSPMFTVNFGTGTAEEAARWVEYVNKKKNANVKYWEIGNEIYGAWHPQYEKYGKDGGHAYGKRAREFITAMKRVDPSIKVGVVGVIDGEWNANVLKYTADVADALIIHHYPQHYGEENDFGLLASPQDLEPIFARIRETIRKNSRKDLEIWLTEWGSVDFNPGPQSISMVNALFMADYLGMLAKVGAASAQYWDIHNDLTEYGGDYGYLSRSYEEQIGGNKPRPGYYGFQMASDGIRGKLVESKSGNDNLTTYLSQDGKKKTLLVVNKSPYTAFNGALKIPGFTGRANIEVLATPKGQAAGKVIKIDPPKSSSMDIKDGTQITFPAHSITLITII